MSERTEYVIRTIVLLLLAILLGIMVTASRSQGRIPVTVPVAAKPQPAPLQEFLNRKAVVDTTNFIRSSNYRIDRNLAQQMAEAYLHAAQLYNIDLELLVAKDWKESRFDPKATSRDSKGNPIARGVAQFTLDTGKSVWGELGFEWRGAESLYDPFESILAGAHYLNKLILRYKGNIVHALEAYNMGPTRLDKLHRLGKTIKYVYATHVCDIKETL